MALTRVTNEFPIAKPPKFEVALTFHLNSSVNFILGHSWFIEILYFYNEHCLSVFLLSSWPLPSRFLCGLIFLRLCHQTPKWKHLPSNRLLSDIPGPSPWFLIRLQMCTFKYLLSIENWKQLHTVNKSRGEYILFFLPNLLLIQGSISPGIILPPTQVLIPLLTSFPPVLPKFFPWTSNLSPPLNLYYQPCPPVSVIHHLNHCNSLQLFSLSPIIHNEIQSLYFFQWYTCIKCKLSMSLPSPIFYNPSMVSHFL